MDNKHLFTSPENAIAEIHKRRQNKTLVEGVLTYLQNDIPEHFNNSTSPILYLARHVATPSFETLRFIENAKQFNLPIVIGQDIKDTFVSNNCLKRSLGKLSVVKGITRNQDEITESFTVVKFDEVQGKPLNTISTTLGNKLVDLHRELFDEVCPSGVSVVDESTWVDRHSRGNLLEHYKHFLALMLVHGIMFETYLPEDYELVEEVLEPASNYLESRFGVRPLICELISQEQNEEKNWDAYPSVIYPILKKHFDEKKGSQNQGN